MNGIVQLSNGRDSEHPMNFEISSALKADSTLIHALAETLPPLARETAHMIGDRVWAQAKKLEERTTVDIREEAA